MCLAQGPQRSDAGEARTRGPSVILFVIVPFPHNYKWVCLFLKDHFTHISTKISLAGAYVTGFIQASMSTIQGLFKDF